METGRIDLSNSITHRIPLQDVNEGVALIESRKVHVQRIVIDMEKSKHNEKYYRFSERG